MMKDLDEMQLFIRAAVAVAYCYVESWEVFMHKDIALADLNRPIQWYIINP